MNEPWIQLEGVNLDRAGRPVLRDVDASLSGRAIGLVGANGAGKSTLIGALLGVLKAKSGRIRVMGLDVPRSAMEVRTRTGVMAEQAGVFPGGSGVEAVVFAGMLSGLARREALRRAHRALDALDVGEERYRPSRGYSTGMRQRTKLAMSLVHDPQFLILDEPTVGLDPPGRRQLLELIRDPARRRAPHSRLDAHHAGRGLPLRRPAPHRGGDDCLLRAPCTSSCTRASSRSSPRAQGSTPTSPTRSSAPGIACAERVTRGSPSSPADEDLTIFWRLAAERNAEVRYLGSDALTLEDAVVSVMEGKARPGKEAR